MTTITVAQEIETARGEFGDLLAGAPGAMTSHYWEGFGEIAARYRGARDESRGQRDFAAAIHGLTADARGDLKSGAWEVREVPPMPSRAPWATMPTDGSGRMNPAERVLYAVTGTVCVAVLMIIGFLLSGHAIPADAPAAGDGRNASQVVSDADKITQGGYWSWQAADACGRGHTECAAVLREVNMAASQYGLKVWEDGSISPLDN